ncbi:hypothetical protein [Acidipropionibacterium thoenii]|uniref:hypothetical protein n=1 Tax=Acidipropionibacterium thoenii TaxID=1751 RepID=UPI00042884C4|nr:hypothetical protein [Acidipropionibacterium thoenii]
MSLRAAERMLITSYDSDGERHTTVEEVVAAGDTQVGFWLANDQGVRDRFPDNAVVSVRAATRRGQAVTEEPMLEGRAFVISEGPVFEQVRKEIFAKYKTSWTSAVSTGLRNLFAGSTPQCVVLVKLLG